MEVCLITRYFNTDKKEGVGIGRVSLEVLKGLSKRGINVKKIYTTGSGLYSYFLYTTIELPFRIKGDFDVYHALTPMEGIWIPKDKSVVTYHDLFQITNPDRLGGGMGYSLIKRFIGTNYFRLACNLASKARRVVCVSYKTKENVIKYLRVPECKIRVIRSGIPPSLEPRENKNKVFRIGYIGMLDRRKRVNLLIQAFLNSKIDAELDIAGGGLDGNLLVRAALGDSRIRFLGSIKDLHLNLFYNSLDLFVFPTWLEGYGLPIVEAMACKKPVVVLEDALIPEEIKSRCVVVENLKDLLKSTDSVSSYIKEVDLESNYKFAKEHSWDKAIDEYLKVYQEVIDG